MINRPPSYIALDIETTGFDGSKDQLIEVAAVKFADDKIIESFSSLIKSPVPIPEMITHITGITDEMLKSAPDFSDIADELAKFIGDLPIVGHFISFDVGFLQKKGLHLPNQLLDTCALAQVLLPNEASYSLEILSHQLGLKHVNKHRALDDTLVSIELLNFLKQKIAAIPENTLNQIKTQLQKSTWPWKDEFLKYSKTPPCTQGGEGGGNMEPQKSDQSAFLSNPFSPCSPAPLPPCSPAHLLTCSLPPSNPHLKQLIAKTLESPKSLLVEAELYSQNDYLQPIDDFLKNNQKKIIICLPHLSTSNFELPTSNFQLLQPSTHYLCQNRLQTFLKKSQLTDSQTTFIIKILCWLNETNTGSKNELIFQRDEHLAWEEINYNEAYCQTCNPDSCFYLRTKALTQTKKLIITTPETLIKHYQELFPVDFLIIDQTEDLEEKLSASLTLRFSAKQQENELDQLLEQFSNHQSALTNLKQNLTIFYGLLGILLKNHAPTDFAREITVTKTTQTSLEWKNVLQASQNLIDRFEILDLAVNPIAQLFLNNLKKLHYLLIKNDNTLLSIIETETGEIIFKAVPINIGKIFQSTLVAGSGSTILISEACKSQQNYHYTRVQLSLPEQFLDEDLKNPAVTAKIPVFSLIDLPVAQSPAFIKSQADIIKKIITKKTGRVMVVNSSTKTSQQLTELLAPHFKPLGIQVLAQNSGGLGKIVQLYNKSPDKSVVIGTYGFFQKFYENCPPETRPTDLIITTIPFDPPNDPLLSLRSEKYSNRFIEFALPRTIIKIKKVISQFVKSGGLFITTLDNRFHHPSYGREIRQSLPDYLKIISLTSQELDIGD